MNNFHKNSDDLGERWFDDSDAETRMIEFVLTKLEDKKINYSECLRTVDLGTGNGHLLFQLSLEISENPNLAEDVPIQATGVDYSPESIELATSIGDTKFKEYGVHFEQVNFLTKNEPFLLRNEGSYDLVLDKGTFDAIALNQEPIEEFGNKVGVQIYSSQVLRLMHKHSILVITSCNFTEDELENLITQQNTNLLSVWEKIEYPSIMFGGKQGSTICTVAFRKEE